MKFDFIVGNPPYNNKSKTVYHLFIQRFLKLDFNQMIIVIPNNWMTGGKGLSDFRKFMKNTTIIEKIVEYPDDFEIFSEVWIRSGVGYILFNKKKKSDILNHTRILDGKVIQDTDRTLKDTDIVIRDAKAVNLIHRIPKEKIKIPNIKFMIPSDFNNYTEHPFPGCVKLYGQRQKMIPKNGGVKGIGYIKDDFKYQDKYKVITRKATSNNSKRGVNPVFIIEKNAVCSDTYIVLGVFTDLKEAENFCLYQSTKFVRYLVEITKSNVQINPMSFRFVPKYEGLNTDKEIIKYYNLSSYKDLIYSIKDRKVNHIDKEQYPRELNQWTKKVRWVD